MAEQTLHEQMKAERKFYLGYTDKVPGSNQSVTEAREEYRAAVTKDEEAETKRRDARMKVRNAKKSQVTQTTVVSHGVTREIVLESGVKVSESKKADTPKPTADDPKPDETKATDPPA